VIKCYHTDDNGGPGARWTEDEMRRFLKRPDYEMEDPDPEPEPDATDPSD